jgi:hypothetical protein
MLKDNGFPIINLKRSSTAIFATVDVSKLRLADFYLWSDIDPKTSENDVWRLYKIPTALWSCPVFQDNFWKTSDILPISSGFTYLSSP